MFEQYTNLLLSAAAALDTQFVAKRIKHQVFSHELYDHDDPDIEVDSFDIETPVSTLQAFVDLISMHVPPVNLLHHRLKGTSIFMRYLPTISSRLTYMSYPMSTPKNQRNILMLSLIPMTILNHLIQSLSMLLQHLKVDFLPVTFDVLCPNHLLAMLT